MNSLTDFSLRKKYDKVKKLRPNLNKMKSLFDWKSFEKLFPARSNPVGRPNYDRILMIKCLFLQSWFGLSDEELEYQLYNRLDFQDFLDFPDKIPDYSTIWRFREELTENDLIDQIWAEQKRQLSKYHIQVKEGKIQDATFIEANPGKKNSGMNNRGREGKTSRSKDGSWTKKNNKNYFGFKAHTKVQKGSKLIEELAVTTASTHDSNIDLANEDDIIYRDKGYTGSITKAKGNGTMKRRKKLTIKEKLRNKRIQRKRAEGEHPYAVIKRNFKGGFTRLTTLGRVFVQQVFIAMAYNLYRLNFLVRT
jgi:IS5 family transposase